MILFIRCMAQGINLNPRFIKDNHLSTFTSREMKMKINTYAKMLFILSILTFNSNLALSAPLESAPNIRPPLAIPATKNTKVKKSPRFDKFAKNIGLNEKQKKELKPLIKKHKIERQQLIQEMKVRHDKEVSKILTDDQMVKFKKLTRNKKNKPNKIPKKKRKKILKKKSSNLETSTKSTQNQSKSE